MTDFLTRTLVSLMTGSDARSCVSMSKSMEIIEDEASDHEEIPNEETEKPVTRQPEAPVNHLLSARCNLPPRPDGVKRANCTPPCELHFIVPDECEPGVTVLQINGPHGIMPVQIAKNANPGEKVTIRLCPTTAYEIIVPENAPEGTEVQTQLPDGTSIQAIIPPGREAGDKFYVSPPALMVQVPQGAVPGETVCITDPQGEEHQIKVPPDTVPGQYFEYLEKPKGKESADLLGMTI
eukprot:TRINITY_DN22183_c0_g1_i2.p1 TRINITY_DN22183_c0_g1~~TRINITY_DN22183_c0_g1_i2.p1  ORF type:complete len:237 (+),score=45.50 TRINITY_DN22183_c0_g1_i2:108-818(+)